MRFAGFLLFVAGLMTMPVAHAAEARSAERLVKNDQQGVVYAIPKDSPFKVEKKSIDGVYFSGQVQLTGKYVYGRNNPADEVGIAYPKPDLYFMPDDQSRWLLPYLKERGAVAGFYFRNADAFPEGRGGTGSGGTGAGGEDPLDIRRRHHRDRKLLRDRGM
jgi:hypothetical protein